ncbi:hypothetical protein D3C81_1666560 [compost metagenome]
MVAQAPLALASSAFSAELTVPISFTPRAFAHWQAIRPTPPAAAWKRMVSPPLSSKVWRSRYCTVRPLSMTAAACSKLMLSGRRTSLSAGSTCNSL